MAVTQQDWIRAPEAAQMLGVHPQTVKAWAGRGFLVAHQPYPGAHNWISLTSVKAILEARKRALERLPHQAPEATASSGGEAKNNRENPRKRGKRDRR